MTRQPTVKLVEWNKAKRSPRQGGLVAEIYHSCHRGFWAAGKLLITGRQFSTSLYYKPVVPNNQNTAVGKRKENLHSQANKLNLLVLNPNNLKLYTSQWSGYQEWYAKPQFICQSLKVPEFLGFPLIVSLRQFPQEEITWIQSIIFIWYELCARY